MIVLDTNVLWETLRPQPDDSVLAWLATLPVASVFTTTITRAEILYGLCLLPAGRRRDKLRHAVTAIFREDFPRRMLAFDSPAADAYAHIAAARRHAGGPIGQLDAMIAAVTCSRGAVLATRNTKDFVDCDIELVNPWSSPRA